MTLSRILLDVCLRSGSSILDIQARSYAPPRSRRIRATPIYAESFHSCAHRDQACGLMALMVHAPKSVKRMALKRSVLISL